MMRAGKTLLHLCCLAVAGLSPLFVATPANAQQSLEARLAAYRERVARLEDQDAVENLQATFGFYFDKGLWNDAADLFARNGTFEYGQSGVYIGQDRIRHALLLFGPRGLAQGYLNNHMMLQPVIIVAPDGKTATGRWQGPVQLSEPVRTACGVWVSMRTSTSTKVASGSWRNCTSTRPPSLTTTKAGRDRCCQ